MLSGLHDVRIKGGMCYEEKDGIAAGWPYGV